MSDMGIIDMDSGLMADDRLVDVSLLSIGLPKHLLNNLDLAVLLRAMYLHPNLLVTDPGAAKLMEITRSEGSLRDMLVLSPEEKDGLEHDPRWQEIRENFSKVGIEVSTEELNQLAVCKWYYDDQWEEVLKRKQQEKAGLSPTAD